MEGAKQGNTAQIFPGSNNRQKFYRKAHSFMVHSKPFKNFTIRDTENWVKDLEAWEAPDEITEGFPFYHTGYDDQDRPVWVVEVGKFNVYRVVQKGKEAMADLEKYLCKSCVNVLKSMHAKDKPGREMKDSVFINDWGGLDMGQIMHWPTMVFILGLCRKYVEIPLQAVTKVVAFNVNYIGEMAIKIARPVLGNFFYRIEIHGTDRDNWMAALQRHFPPESIPAKFGGSAEPPQTILSRAYPENSLVQNRIFTAQ